MSPLVTGSALSEAGSNAGGPAASDKGRGPRPWQAPFGSRAYPARLLIVASILLSLFVAITTAYLLSSLRTRAIDASRQSLSTTASVLAEQTNAAFQALTLAQNNVIEMIQRLDIDSSAAYVKRMSGHEVHQMLRNMIVSLPYVDAINLISAEGQLFNYSRRWPVGAVDISDRDFFRTLKGDPKLTTMITEPVRNRTTGTWTIYLARKITGPDGSFIGLVLGAVPLEYFESFYARIATDPGDAVALLRSDGLLLTRHPRSDRIIGQHVARSAMFADRKGPTTRIVIQHVGSIDGQERLIAGQPLEHFPMVIAVSTTVERITASWRTEAGYLVAMGLAVLLLIGGTCLVIIYRLQEQGVILDVALNNMPYGLVMVDADNRLAVVNRRFGEMYDVSSELITLGASARQFADRRLAASSLLGEAAEFLADMRHAIGSGRTDERILHTADGRLVAVSTYPLPGGVHVSTHDDITERYRAEERITFIAHHDTLTGLPNRMAFSEKAPVVLGEAAASGTSVAFLCIDFDRFKEINDVCGHSGGDAMLRDISSRIQQVADGAFFARIGGDEFILISEGTQPEGARALAAKLQATIRGSVPVNGQMMRTGLSIGIAVYPTDGRDLQTLLANADAALYRAKAEGRGRTVLFDPSMDQQLRRRRALQKDLEQALGTDQLSLHYQPQATLDRTVFGFEALLRWNHPHRGAVSPGEFIPLAEEGGIILALGEWVLREACREAATWARPLKVAVNLSPLQFRDNQLPARIRQILVETGLAPGRLKVEVTEGVLIDDYARAVATLRRIKELGVEIALDDFGKGFSSLSYLQAFPFDQIKIDKGFISDVDRNPQSAAIVRSVIGLGKGLGVPVLAEGVETPGQLEFLAAEVCDHVQGYLIGRALPMSAYQSLVAIGSARGSDAGADAATAAQRAPAERQAAA